MKHIKNIAIIISVFLALLSVPILFYFVFADVSTEEKTDAFLTDSFDTQVNQAIIAGWNWLYRYDNNFLDPVGISFIIKTINDKYCHSVKMETFWKDISKKFENDSYLSVFERFISDEKDYEISNKVLAILKIPQAYYDDVLPQALYCDLYPVREDFATKAFNGIGEKTGYDLTHKFWSAILFKENGCVVEGYDINEVILAGARKIVVEQDMAEKFDDLYAERTAFLMNYGFRDLVKESWIKNMAKNQLKSGAWINSVEDGGSPHTTALSIWALIEYSEVCPFQE